LGSASLDLCFVACGRYDAYFEEHLYPWDLAAGALIASEAGTHVEVLADAGPTAHAVLAANPQLFPKIKTLLLSQR
ncbi:MAG: hypothetical protein RL743_946, partial [Actinomycetota bacterium]